MKARRLIAITIAVFLISGLIAPYVALGASQTFRFQANGVVDGRDYPWGPEGSMGLNGLPGRSEPDRGANVGDGKTAWVFGAQFNPESQQRALMYFNLDGWIPTDAVVESATLHIHTNWGYVAGIGLGNADVDVEVEIFRIQDPDGTGLWVRGNTPERDPAEGSNNPTFTHKNKVRGAMVPWSSDEAGGINAVTRDYEVGRFTQNANSDGWVSVDLTEDVASMVANPASNIGWMLETFGDYPFNFFSPDQHIEGLTENGGGRGDAEWALAPILEVTFSVGGVEAEEAESDPDTAAPVETEPPADTGEAPKDDGDVRASQTGENVAIFIAVGVLLLAACGIFALRRKVKVK